MRLRLPTPQCAPNFAFLMAADARAAVRRCRRSREVTVVLEDHYTGDEINAAVGAGDGLRRRRSPGETTGDLDALRELFRRKALLARQARLCQALLADGASPEAVAALRVADLPDSPDALRGLELRAALGLAARPATRRPSLPATGGRSAPTSCRRGCAAHGSSA